MRTGLRFLIGTAVAGAFLEYARRKFLAGGGAKGRLSADQIASEAVTKPDFPVDEASEDSFPASDPPSYMGSGRMGRPKH